MPEMRSGVNTEIFSRFILQNAVANNSLLSTHVIVFITVFLQTLQTQTLRENVWLHFISRWHSNIVSQI